MSKRSAPCGLPVTLRGAAWEERAKKQERERRRIKKHGRSLLSAHDTPLGKRLGRRIKRKRRR